MRPLVGSISRLIILSVVVLPQPEGPTSTHTSPAATSSDSSDTAGGALPYRLLTASSRIIGCPAPDANGCHSSGRVMHSRYFGRRVVRSERALGRTPGRGHRTQVAVLAVGE